MAQFPTFYKFHRVHGPTFQALIVEGGRLDRKLGFPIFQVRNKNLLELYDAYLTLRRKAQQNNLTKEELRAYHEVMAAYRNEVKQYHINR
jgi:hypothetical protein